MHRVISAIERQHHQCKVVRLATTIHCRHSSRFSSIRSHSKRVNGYLVSHNSLLTHQFVRIPNLPLFYAGIIDDRSIPEATSQPSPSQRKSKAIHLTFERLPPLGEIPLMVVIKSGRQYISYLNTVTQDIFGTFVSFTHPWAERHNIKLFKTRIVKRFNLLFKKYLNVLAFSLLELLI